MPISLFDKTTVLINESLSIDDYNVLALLYQPIIGIKSYSLYLTLYALLSRSNFKVNLLHSEITDLLGLSISEFETERKKLEAIGLLNTYKKDEEYVYLMKSPLSARQFLKDGILGVYLQNVVGDELFIKIVDRFKIEKFNKEGYTNITCDFDSIFQSKISDKAFRNDGYFMDKNNNDSVKINNSFDFEFFMQGLPFGENISKELEDAIIKTAFSYDINEREMQQVYYRALTDGEVSIMKLSKEAKALSKYKNQQQNESGNIMNCTPKQIVAQITGKKRISTSELETVNRLISETNYDNATINILLMYVLKGTKNIMPPYTYFEKILLTWNKHGVKTYDDAIKFLSNDKTEKQKNTKKEDNDPWLDDFMNKFKEMGK